MVVQLKQKNEEKLSEMKKTNFGLKQSLQTCQNELVQTKELLELARRSYYPLFSSNLHTCCVSI